ncbi:MAG: M48 family metalloprotease [Phycisphaerales bacterium]
MTALVNNIKTVVLLGLLTAIFVGVGAVWGVEGMVVGLVVGGLMNLGAWWFSDRIAIAAMRGQEVTRESAPELHYMVDRLRRRAELPMPRVYICPQEAPNAFATGRNPHHSAVAMTRGLLHIMNERELEGVIAHELAHIKNRDTLISTVAATIAGTLAFLAQWGFFFMGGRDRGANPLALLGIVILGAVGAALIKAAISRSREFVADAEGARIAGSSDGLASALARLEATARRVPLDNPNPAMNNMFIVEPFMGQTLTNLFASHPPTERRIAALRELH